MRQVLQDDIGARLARDTKKLMASAPTRRCPKCRQLVQGKCEKCKPTINKSKNRPGDPFYNGQAWRRLRKLVLSEEPLCRHCRQKGRTTAASEVDHIVSRKKDQSREYDRENLQSLCKSCHSAKTSRERAHGDA